MQLYDVMVVYAMVAY